MDPNFRALLHPSVRTQPNGLTSSWADALLAFSLSEVSNKADGSKTLPSFASTANATRTQNPRTPQQ